MRTFLRMIFIVGIITLVFLHFENNPLLVDELSRVREFESSRKNLLLPDIIISSPGEIYIENIEGKKKIRFSTTFYNQGQGSLELIGKPDPEQVVMATQRIITTDGSFIEREVGEFILHPDHNHWHIEEYVVFQLWSKKNGERGELLSTTKKMSFCIWDQEAFNLFLENAPQSPRYLSCDSEIQGLSVGWSDTYLASVEGQELDITSVSDGNYLISAEINPDKKILESDYANNEVIIEININGNVLTPKK